MPHVAILYYSGYGHTEKQAKAVQAGAASVEGVTTVLLKADETAPDSEVLTKADAIIFGAPTYMGSAPAPFKAFMDQSSKVWAQRGWQDKLAAGFTNSASQNGDKLSTLSQLMLFAMQHGMIWVGLGLLPGNNSSKGSPQDLNRLGAFMGAMAQSNNDEPPETAPPAADLKTAEHLGRRVAQTALRLAAARG